MNPPDAPKKAAKKARKRPRLLIALAAAMAVVAMATVAVVLWLTLWRTPNATTATAEENAPAIIPTGDAPRPTTVVTFAQGCMTAECHTSMAHAPATHPSVARGVCDVCHAPDAGEHTYPLLRSKTQICAPCHDTGGHDPFQHRAMSDDGCLACHDPHAATTESLLIDHTLELTCARCHPPSPGSSRHGPYDDGHCDACHDPHGANNRTLLLVSPGADHCRICHADVVHELETGLYNHAGIENECLACHEPHAADHGSLFKDEPRKVCVTCHADIGQAIADALVSHDPVLKDDQCVTCHEPHASSRPTMLRDDQTAICLSCHDEPVTAADGRIVPEIASALAAAPVVHGAVRDGECSACHSVHGATHARLLTEINPDVLIGLYDLRHYALCFSCHDPALTESNAATQFRDGRRNLHEIHLRVGDQVRGCSDCHAVHVGNSPRLIVSTVNYQGSGWKTPMGFELTEHGGSCATACHEHVAYSRLPGGAKANGGAP